MFLDVQKHLKPMCLLVLSVYYALSVLVFEDKLTVSHMTEVLGVSQKCQSEVSVA